MIIYLKGGQVISFGEVNYILDSCGCEYMNGDDILDSINCIDSDVITFYNTNNETLEVKCSELVAIRKEVK